MTHRIALWVAVLLVASSCRAPGDEPRSAPDPAPSAAVEPGGADATMSAPNQAASPEPQSPDAGPPLLQPGAPGEPSRPIAVADAVDLSRVEATEADVEFMQGMIGHHAQALEMTALLYDRTDRDDMRLLAQRIDVSQADEIKMMQEWLRARGEQVPAGDEHHAHGAMLMPGMLTPDQMSQLEASTGTEFDRLFLEFMIQHHAGALTMVEDLLATPGAAQESQIFAFVSDVDADQRMEITRMRRMRGALDVP